MERGEEGRAVDGEGGGGVWAANEEGGGGGRTELCKKITGGKTERERERDVRVKETGGREDKAHSSHH